MMASSVRGPLVAEPPGELPSGWLGVQLRRLRRLHDLKSAYAGRLNENGERLLHRAIFATYVECRELGAADLAAGILTEEDAQECATGAQPSGTDFAT